MTQKHSGSTQETVWLNELLDFSQHSRILQKWRPVAYMDKGTFSRIFQVMNRETGEKAALKFVPNPLDAADCCAPNTPEEEFHRSRFNDSKREARIMQRFHGRNNVVQYLEEPEFLRRTFVNNRGVQVVQYAVLICMPLYHNYKEWETEIIRSREKRLELGMDIALALTLFEKEGVYHRDLKPGNILLDSNGYFCLSDVGEAKLESEFTTIGFHGTRPYMAPEVYRHEFERSKMRSDHRSDIYSLGIILYRLFNHQRFPFLTAQGDLTEDAHKSYRQYAKQNQLADSDAHLSASEKARLLRYDGKKLPPPREADEQLARVILRACAYDVKNRYQTARELYLALCDCYEGRRSAAAKKRKKSSIQKKTKKMILSASVGLLAGIFVLLAVWAAVPVETEPSAVIAPTAVSAAVHAVAPTSGSTRAALPAATASAVPVQTITTVPVVSLTPVSQVTHTPTPPPTPSVVVSDTKKETDVDIPVLVPKKPHVNLVASDFPLWLIRATEKADPEARRNLGIHYLEGIGVTADETEAAKWFRLAAEQEDAIAQTILGNCYYWGRGVGQSYAEAAKWYEKASKTLAEARYNMGVCYLYGQGVRKSTEVAEYWFEGAALAEMSTASDNSVSSVDPAASAVKTETPSPAVPRLLLTDEASPLLIEKGDGFYVKGTISAENGRITYVSAAVVDLNGNVLFYGKDTPDTQTYRLDDSIVDEALRFGSLRAGTYIYEVSASISNGETEEMVPLVNRKFSVADNIPVQLKQSPVSISIDQTKLPRTITKGHSFSIDGYVRSSGIITEVTASVYDAAGKAVLEFSDDPCKTVYRLKSSAIDKGLKFGSLGSGTYTFELTATATNGAESQTETLTVQSFTVQSKNIRDTLQPAAKKPAATSLVTASPAPNSPSRTSSANADISQAVTKRPDKETAAPVQIEVAKKWGNWSDWGTAPVSSSSTRQVETKIAEEPVYETVYRYSRWTYFNTDPQYYGTMYSYTEYRGTSYKDGSGKWEYKTTGSPLSKTKVISGHQQYAGYWYNETVSTEQTGTETTILYRYRDLQ